MSEFNELKSLEEVPETLEAPKKATRKPKPTPLETEFDEKSVEECPPAPKKGKGRPKKVVIPVEPVEEDQEPVSQKPKRVQSEAQKANFVKALAARQANIALRKAAKEAEQNAKVAVVEEKKKEIQRKVLKKATVLKKREILEQTAIDEIPSDDDIPNEIIEKIIKKQRAKSAPKSKPVASAVTEPIPQSKYNFV